MECKKYKKNYEALHFYSLKMMSDIELPGKVYIKGFLSRIKLTIVNWLKNNVVSSQIIPNS